MRLGRFIACLASVVLVTIAPLATAGADQPGDAMHHHPQAPQATGQAATDARSLVELPEPMRRHMLANMRDHLLALQQIQEALANDEFDEAAQIAEHRLGMSSLALHGAHEVAPYMPERMRQLGAGMHRAASRFAVTASDASVTGDLGAALAALARVTAQCVACHDDFRVQ